MIMALRYQVASELEFYLPEDVLVYCMNDFGRGNQYDVSGNITDSRGHKILVISENEIQQKLHKKFMSVDKSLIITQFHDEVPYKRFFLYNCRYF